MVTASFSMDKLLYKILMGQKHQTFRCHVGEDDENPKHKAKWADTLAKVERREDVILNLFWKQRSPTECLRIGDVPLTGLERFDMHHLTLEDAIKDGADSLEELEMFFQKTYGEGWRDNEWFRVQWALVPNANLQRPNKTTIDWFQELYTVNPLIFPKGCPYECAYPCYARQMQVVRKLPGIVPGIYPGRIAGIQFARKHVFVESMGDLFHPVVPSGLIRYVIEQLNFYNGNKAQLYFLTKNPDRYKEFVSLFNPETMLLGTTAETDGYGLASISKAPYPGTRLMVLGEVEYPRKFVSVEPIMRFTDTFSGLIAKSGAELVFVGANTGQAAMPEPSATAIDELVELLELTGITVVRKGNLARICEEQATPEPARLRCGLCAACADHESARCSGKNCPSKTCDMTMACFDDGDCEDGCDFESFGQVVPAPAHYRHRKTGELGCMACEKSEGDGPTELYCALFHVQVDNNHHCKLLKESQHSRFQRLQQEADAVATAQAEQAKPKPTTLDKFLRRAA